MADVREYAGVPPVAAFADMGAPFPGGTPIVVNTLTGNAYVLIAGVVTQIIAASPSGAALSKTDDTNVTMTLGGSPTTALLAATSMTLGWTGSLSVARGGTGYAVRPAFLVYKTSTQANITGTGTIATITWDAEAFDNGGDFASNTFTAPVTGKYLLSAQVRFNGLTAAATVYAMNIVTTARTYPQRQVGTAATLLTGPSISNSVLANMTANDTATITVEVSGEATDVVDVLFGSTGNEQTFFSGYLAA